MAVTDASVYLKDRNLLKEKLDKYKFYVKVPTMALMSEVEIRLFGMVDAKDDSPKTYGAYDKTSGVVSYGPTIAVNKKLHMLDDKKIERIERKNDKESQMHVDITTARLSLSEIIRIHNDGFGISLLRKSDILKATEALSIFLEDITYGVRVADAGIKDTIKNFLEEVLNVNMDKLVRDIEEANNKVTDDVFGSSLFTEVDNVKTSKKFNMSDIEV